MIAAGGLRVTATQITGWQHGDGTDFVQHRLGSQTDVGEQALGAATREIEHRFGVFGDFGWVAYDRYHAVVFYTQQGTRGFSRHFLRHGPVDEMHHLRFYFRLANGGRRPNFVFQQMEFFRDTVGKTLRAVTYGHHKGTHQFNGGRVFGVQKRHAQCRAWVKLFFALLTQEVSHGYRHVSEIDVDRAWV